MYRKIDIGCQTKDNPLFCNDCIFANDCPSRAQKGKENKENAVSVVEPDLFKIWKESSKRKPVTP
jgi:hypothetical protein